MILWNWSHFNYPSDLAYLECEFEVCVYSTIYLSHIACIIIILALVFTIVIMKQGYWSQFAIDLIQYFHN
jgi:hypothetical protein